MNNQKIIIDKEYHFASECIVAFIIGSFLLISMLAFLSYLTEPAYASNEPVLEVGVFFLSLAIIVIASRVTLKRCVYIDLEKQDIRIYFKFFAFEATYSLALIQDILEIGVNSVRYTSSLNGQKNVSNCYYAVLLRNDGKVLRISGERGNLAAINKSVEKLAEKLQKPVFSGKENTPVYARYDTGSSKYKLSYASGFKALLGRANGYEKSMASLFILLSFLLIIIPNG